MNSRGFVHMALAVVILFVFGGLGYLYWQNEIAQNRSSNETPTTTSTNTTDIIPTTILSPTLKHEATLNKKVVAYIYKENVPPAGMNELYVEFEDGEKKGVSQTIVPIKYLPSNDLQMFATLHRNATITQGLNIQSVYEHVPMIFMVNDLTFPENYPEELVTDALFEADLVGWSSDDTSLWGQVTATGPYIISIFVIHINDYSYDKYFLEDILGFAPVELALDPNTGRIAYSDYPALFEEGTANEYLESGATVELKVFNLITGVETLIKDSITKSFNPEWYDGNLEYDDPLSKNKLQYQFIN